MRNSHPPSLAREARIDLQTGQPYADLISSHKGFASVVGEYFGVNPDDILPTAGATGKIEAVRNHVFRLFLKAHPVLFVVHARQESVLKSFFGSWRCFLL